MSYEDVRKQLSMAFSKDPNKSDGYNTARQQLVESFGGVPSKRPGGTGIARKPEPVEEQKGEKESLFGIWLKNLADIGNNADPYAGYATDPLSYEQIYGSNMTTERAPAKGRLADTWQNAIETNPRTSVSTASQFMGGGQPIQFEEPARTVKPGRTLDQVRAQNVEETWEPGEERAKRISAKPGQTVEERRAAIFEEGAKPAAETRDGLADDLSSAEEKLRALDEQDRTWWGPMDWDNYDRARIAVSDARKALDDYDTQEAYNEKLRAAEENYAAKKRAYDEAKASGASEEEIDRLAGDLDSAKFELVDVKSDAPDTRSVWQKATDKILGINAGAVTGGKTDWLKLLGGTIVKGANQINASLWRGVDLLFGDAAQQIHALGVETINGIISGINMIPGANIAYLGEGTNAISSLTESAVAGQNAANAEYYANANTSRAAQVVDKFGTSFVAAIPMALEAAFLAYVPMWDAAARGLHLASPVLSEATTAGLKYFSGLQSATGLEQIGMMAKAGQMAMLQNPMFWTSYLQAVGDSFENVQGEEGMSDMDKGLYALVNGYFNAMIEIGGADEALGGIQNLPMRLQDALESGNKYAVVDWFKDSVLGEGWEEVQQGAFERGFKAPSTGAPMFSLDPNDENAVINPYTAADEFFGGAVVGGLLGGGEVALGRAVESARNAAQRRAETEQALQEGAQTEEQQEAPRPTREARPEIEEEGRAEAQESRPEPHREAHPEIEEEGMTEVPEKQPEPRTTVEEQRAESVADEAAHDVAEEATEEKPATKGTPRPRAAAQETTDEAPAQKTTVQVKAENRKAVMESIIEREAGRTGTEISASEKSALADAFNIEDGVKGSTYAAAVVEAYSIGKEGNVSLEEARRGSRNGERISASQFQRAFELGRGETASGRTVAVRTKAQSDSLRASLASLGQYAGAAAKAYENGQDIGEYAAAMSEAAERYAVTGADIRAQGGVPADSVISMLTDAQIEKAQEIGGRLRAQRAAAISQLAEQRKAIRAQARAIEQQNAADADALTEINRQIREANKVGKDTVALFEAQREALTKAVEADPNFQDTEEYAKAFDEAKANMEKVKGLQRAVEDLNAKKKALEAKKPTARKKGTVSLDGGNIAGTDYAGIDRGKLNRQQQNIVAMVERLADFINIDYVVFDGPANMGGAYMQGGRLYININAGMTQEGRKSIAAASLSHELTHFMQEYAPEEYQQLKDYVIGTILNKSQTEFDRMIRQQRRWEPGKSYDELADELVANACQTMLTDDKAVQRMARSNMTLAQKVADVLDEIGEKIRKAFEGLSFDEDRAIFAPVKAVMDEIDGITERWADGISAAVENYNAEQTVRQAADTAKQNRSAQFQKWDEVEKEAEKHFGTTDNFRVAGYLMQDGKMLDFSGAHWLDGYDEKYIADWRRKNDIRQVDHEDVYEAFEAIDADEAPSDSSLTFIKRGNIRLVPELPGIELYSKKEPTAAQYRRIKEFIRTAAADPRHYNSETFTVDLTQDRRHRDGALRYEGKINADRVINDLKHFYQTGEVRDSSLSTFYQRFDDTTDDTTSESRGRDIAYARLQSENAILSETVAAMKELTGKQDKTIAALQKRLQVTTTPEVRQSDARKFARQLIRDNGSKADVERVSEQIKALGDYILQTDTAKLDENEMKSRARAIASEILNSATEQINVEDDTFQRIAGEIKGRKLSIDEDFLGEFDQAGGYDAFRKSVFGSFTLAKRESASRETRDGYMTVDQFYTDMQGQYGKGLFPDAANEGEQVQTIAQMLDAAKPMEVNPFEQYMGEATEELANRIVMDAMNGVLRQTVPTTADRQKARTQALKEQIDQLKAENKLGQREAASLYHTVYDLTVALDKAASKYQTLRTEADYRAAQLRAEGTARAAEIKAAERARADSKIKALREYYQRQRQRATEMRNNSANATKYRKQITKKVGVLRDMLVTNSDKVHVPEVLKAPLSDFLSSIDLSSKSLLNLDKATKADEKNHAAFLKLVDLFSRQQEYIDGNGNVQGDLGGYLDISKDSMEFLRGTATLIYEAMQTGQEYTINRMNAEQLKDLSNFLSNLTKAIRDMNNFMANARYESVQSATRADIEHMKALGKASEISASAAVRFAGWENGTPYYILKRFGAGAKSIFDGFAKGWERLAFNAQEIINFTEKAYTDKEVREWKKTIHDITLEDGSKIQMTTAQIMELSMLLGREQAIKHISRGGIRIGDIETKKGTKHDTTHYHLSDGDIRAITGLLTPRQAEVAKKLQRFMADRGAEWGNEISMRRFGYKFYEEGPGYYPIKTDANDRPMADTDAQTNSMFRLLNLSASKALNPKASNALIVGDIFDTFADHMADMAKLNGMGLPILDAIKWFNYKERIDHDDGTYDTVTLQGAMEQAFGEQAQRYFRTLMKDINGVNESGDRGTNLPKKLMSNYKIAAVAANLRVALLQPTSYVRAMTVLKPKYMVGIVPTRAAYREAMKYSGTAVWKALGYYETDISRGLREKIAHDDSFRDKFAEASLSLAELGDQTTWSMLWTACKRQAKAEGPGLAQDALMEKTAELFREVVYSSQVMDSTLTRSEIMRGKTGWTKAMSAFMAEPTLSYNILMNAVSDLNLDERKLGRTEAWKRNSGKLGKAFTVYVASAAFAAVVESIADAVRDDDDEEFWEKFKQALWGEKGPFSGNLSQDLTILGKLPYVKNFISTLQGYTSGDMSVAAFNNLVNVYKIWEETIKLQTGALDKATKVTSYGKMTEWGKVYKTLQALSQLSGFAVSNLTRDVTAIWNTAMNGRRDEWKIRTYDPNALSQSKTEAYEQYVKNAGISKKQYEKILSDANLNGGTVSQDEMGNYLTDALKAKDLTKAQATAVWTSLWNSPSSKTYDKWLEGKTKEAAKPKDDAYANYTKNVSIYGKDEAYEGYKKNLASLGVSLDTFTKTINAANIDGNTSLRQDELGEYLYNQIQNKKMTEEEANAWFLVFWNGQRSKTYSMWAAKNKK